MQLPRLNLEWVVLVHVNARCRPSLGETCGVHTAGKDAVGLPSYFWLTEANSDIAAALAVETEAINNVVAICR
jgi:hypothetical protein